MRDVDLVKLAPGMCPTGGFVDLAAFVEMMKSGVGIGLQCALVVLQVLPGMLALAVRRVSEPHGRSSCICGWPVIPHIGPEPSDPGLAVAWGEHRDWRVVGVQLAGRHHVTASISGASSSLVAPTQPASVERSRSTPSRA